LIPYLIITWKLDRLFRDCADCLTVVRQWDQATVSLHLVDLGGQTVDTSTAMGRFFLTVMAGAAELERNLVRERTKLGMDAKRARGELAGGVPYGHKVARDGATLRPHLKERQVLTRMRRMRGRGMSLRAIVAKLNDDRVPARGKRWHLTTVANLLRR
jgi:site-specific DNA recombinase